MPSVDDGDKPFTITTPRRASATPKRTPAARRVPNSAPARRPTAARKDPVAPTLFQDFLLGRPSPQRTRRPATRRKSLDAVKRELRLGVQEVARVQAPGGVKERVREWQSAAAVPIVDTAAVPDITENEREGDEKVDCRIRDVKKRPRRRKSREAENVLAEKEKAPWKTLGGVTTNGQRVARRRSKSAVAPKKRVISDEHWKKKDVTPGRGAPIPKNFLEKTAANPSAKKKIEEWVKMNEQEEIVVFHSDDDYVESDGERSRRKSATRAKNVPRERVPKQVKEVETPRKGVPIPKGFLTNYRTAQNPSSGKKMEDWFKRNENEIKGDSDLDMTPTKTKAARHTERRKCLPNEAGNYGIRVKPSTSPNDRSRAKSSSGFGDDGIRVKPSPNPSDDGIRIEPMRDRSFNKGDDGIRIKPLRQKKAPKSDDEEMAPLRKRSEKHLRPPVAESSRQEESQYSDDETATWATPSQAESKKKLRKSGSPSDSLSEIPFGNSAFSVLDLPLGAESGTLRRMPAPAKRNSSFGVPRVLKKVYSEAKHIVHETGDPARTAPNQPQNIESWLNQTSDPFVDRPSSPKSTLSAPEDSSRRRSCEEDDRIKEEYTAKDDADQTPRKRRTPSAEKVDDIPSPNAAREMLPSMESSPPVTPTAGLRRRAATRNASSPKPERKIPLKEALLDAFRGESSTGKPRSSSQDFRESQSLERQQDARPAPLDVPSRSIPTIREPSVDKNEPVKPLPAFARRLAPTTGQHRLSTIASVETFTTLSSLAGTESDLSQTTGTQAQSTLSTNPTLSTLSSLSRDSHKSGSGDGLKRRFTKHSDLMSVLSLPDTTAPPGRAPSIRSARSVRTNRSPLDTATLQDLMRELSTDETKYMRELKTLVDGVIPVLLTCVLSKTDSSIAAGLFSNVSDGPDPSFTKPIVDMGVALERLKSLHNRIPLEGSNALVTWLQNASRIYDDYLTAWRMGFQDVVVNLAPSSRSSSAAQTPSRDEMPLNANGDVVKDDGERVDVAFLLKRPLVRVKYLSKLVKGIHKLTLTDASSNTMQRWAELEIRGRRRIKEEAARMIDRAANNIDTTRARDPETLALIEDVKIDQTRQVCAKDSLELDMLHSSGQRVECEVELLLRDKPSDKSDPGDLLICAVDEANKWLLFPPVALSQVSARIGDSPDELVVMIRGDSPYWEEVFLLEADDDEAATEWVDMLGKTPIPPAVARDDVSIISKLATSILPTRQPSKKETDIAIPIGESRRRDAEEVVKKKNSASALLFARASDNSEPAPKNINEAMKKAGKTFTATKNARARYHSQSENSSPSNLLSRPTSTDSNTDHVSDLKNMDVDQGKYIMSGGLPFMPKKRASTDNMPLSESMRPDNLLKKERRKSAGALEDTPPPPPVHRMMSPKPQKSAPELESSTLNKHRRTSSPLKHEYQPSHASETSSSSSMSESEDGSYSDSSEDEELEGTELPGFEIKPLQPLRPKRSPSILSLPSTSLALSNSASQTPYRGVPVQRDAGGARKLVATISAWGGNKWVDLHPGPCSIVVSAGLIEVFEMNASHSSPKIDMYSEGHESEVSIERPLLAQILTPVVNLRQSTAVDIEIKSPATSNSLLKVDSATIRYRTYTVPACLELYAYIHKARCSNPVYEKLAQERMINSYGTHSYEAAVAGNRRRSFFGRKNSYRASNRAPASDNAQRSHSSSTFSRLRDSGIFNIAKSTIMQATGGSQYTESSRTSTFSGPTPPRTPTSPSLSSGTTSGANIVSLGNKNLKIRLYMLANSTSWDDKGSARLDITVPPAGMRQRSSLYTGIERRIVVRVNAHKGEEGVVILDEVLGTSCFQQISRTGIAVNVWEDISDDNGEVGRVGKTGGVSGRTRKWLLQTGSAAERNWIYSLCATAR